MTGCAVLGKIISKDLYFQTTAWTKMFNLLKNDEITKFPQDKSVPVSMYSVILCVVRDEKRCFLSSFSVCFFSQLLLISQKIRWAESSVAGKPTDLNRAWSHEPFMNFRNKQHSVSLIFFCHTIPCEYLFTIEITTIYLYQPVVWSIVNTIDRIFFLKIKWNRFSWIQYQPSRITVYHRI